MTNKTDKTKQPENLESIAEKIVSDESHKEKAGNYNTRRKLRGKSITSEEFCGLNENQRSIIINELTKSGFDWVYKGEIDQKYPAIKDHILDVFYYKSSHEWRTSPQIGVYVNGYSKLCALTVAEFERIDVSPRPTIEKGRVHIKRILGFMGVGIGLGPPL